MNPNITNTVDQPLFYASLTKDQPPRLSVCFSPGGGFKKDGIDCPGSFVAKAGRQIKICLENKTVMNEAAADLASLHDCGRSLAFREIRAGDRTTYFYEDDNEQAEGTSLSQVTLQVRNASLVAEFFQGAAGPVVPEVLPAVQAPVAIDGPAPVQVVVSIPEELVYERLRGDLPQGIFGTIHRLAGISYVDYQWYINHPNPPTDAQKKAAYDFQYPIFLREETLYATLQEKLNAAAAHDRLTGCLPPGDVAGIIDPERRNGNDIYQWWRNHPDRPTTNDCRLQTRYDREYPIFLKKEKEYLAQQARNEYNSAS